MSADKTNVQSRSQAASQFSCASAHLVLANLSSINVNVHNGGTLSEGLQLSGHTIIKTHAQGDKEISLWVGESTLLTYKCECLLVSHTQSSKRTPRAMSRSACG